MIILVAVEDLRAGAIGRCNVMQLCATKGLMKKHHDFSPLVSVVSYASMRLFLPILRSHNINVISLCYICCVIRSNELDNGSFILVLINFHLFTSSTPKPLQFSVLLFVYKTLHRINFYFYSWVLITLISVNFFFTTSFVVEVNI